jgi:hydroxymethylglutaryl-CoA reductase (NADPH)
MTTEDEIVKKLEEGKVKLYEIEGLVGNDSNKATAIRRAFLEKARKSSLKNIGSTSIDFNDAINRNIENPIGAVQIPLGYGGELKVNGESAKGSYPVLLATTEGMLVAGISRGISMLNKVGGVNVSIIKDGMTRDVLIRTKGVKDSAKIIRWVNSYEGFNALKEGFSRSTKHGELLEVRPYTTGRDIHLRFKAKTGAAMGMNMVTIAAKEAVESALQGIKEKLGVDAILISESGNMCSDKKPAFINFLEGRGVSVVADAIIPRDLLQERFRVEPEAVAELNRAKNLSGSALAGSHGFNAHISNILAAMYIAHGQDVAQIVEGAQALTEANVVDEGLYVSVMLPAIEVGTFGGGSRRETQKEALMLLGLYGEGDSEGRTRLAFAEIVAGACLAGELNLLAAQAAKELSKSHGSLKRGK